ncbi:MAG TPA: glycosyltransferase family 9 protein [Ktedonobacterales bacterium]|jgi:ADP-heptose:LPS heptosyltransferase|nr:glycosyltransferase family 9 protein [Ktedonobacterales bacterium]
MNAWLDARELLAVRPDNIGDVIMLGPALRAVKETSPQSRITLLASPAGASAAPLLPWIDDVIVERVIWQDVGGRIAFDPAREQALVARLAQRHFDAALIFTSFSQSPHTPGYLCYLAGIPLRAGESKEFGGSALTTELHGAPDEMHQVERNLRLVESLGYVARDRTLRVFLTNDDREEARRLLRGVGVTPEAPYIVLHPGASAQARRYPTERYGAVARVLDVHGWQTIVTGVERERELLSVVERAAPSVPHIMNDGRLGVYAAIIEQAALVICNDTLPMHLADALLTPEVALYAGTELESQWRPRATRSTLLRRPTPCQPCYLFTCPIGQRCLDIPPEEVVTAAEAVLTASVSVARHEVAAETMNITDVPLMEESR